MNVYGESYKQIHELYYRSLKIKKKALSVLIKH